MEDYLNARGVCGICKEEPTTINAEVTPGVRIYVCEKCLESAKKNFIWLCVHCGSVFIRPKSIVLNRLKDPELRRAYLQCEDMQIIQGIDRCIECDPLQVMETVAASQRKMNAGQC